MIVINAATGIFRRWAFPCYMLVLCLALVPATTFAQAGNPDPRLDTVAGELAANEPLIDPDFGVAVRALGLRRTVAMWQWQLTTGAAPVGAHYQALWSQQPIDSSNFDPAHRNPSLPFASAQWWSDSALLNGQLVSPTLLATLDGWQEQAAQVDRLPENLAAIFRVENGVLFTGSDSTQPQIGDLRVSWQALPAGSVHGLALVGDAGLAMAEGAGLIRGMNVEAELPGLAQGARAGSDLAWWLLAAVLLGLALLVMVRRRAGK